MNYLSHFVFNHVVCGLPPEPHFAMGVVLPDLWLRFSRRRRIRWRAVRAAAPGDAVDVGLRAGLLNHVEVDRRFHLLPTFLRWQSELRRGAEADGTHPALVDFLVHMGIELALDHRLLVEDPALLARFYTVVAACDPRSVARRVGELAAVEPPVWKTLLRGSFRGASCSATPAARGCRRLHGSSCRWRGSQFQGTA